MARYAVIRADGTINWWRDGDLLKVTHQGVGSYVLEFLTACDQDVFVANAKTVGGGCDAPSVVVTLIQSGTKKICVAVSYASNPLHRIDAQFSYVRYREVDKSLVSESSDEQPENYGTCLPCEATENKNWYAWMDLMPPVPYDLHLIGDVYVANPGVTPLLLPRVPQGVNPQVLLLDLYLCQAPGIWPQVLVWRQARYDRVQPNEERYTQIQVFCGDAVIADVVVAEAQ